MVVISLLNILFENILSNYLFLNFIDGILLCKCFCAFSIISKKVHHIWSHKSESWFLLIHPCSCVSSSWVMRDQGTTSFSSTHPFVTSRDSLKSICCCSLKCLGTILKQSINQKCQALSLDTHFYSIDLRLCVFMAAVCCLDYCRCAEGMKWERMNSPSLLFFARLF